MRTKAVAVTICVLLMAVSVQAEPSIMQSLRTANPPNWLAVSPSGNQMCVTNLRGLQMHVLGDDGRVETGPALKTIRTDHQLTCAAISPDGKWIIATDGGTNLGCTIHIIKRGDWTVRQILYTEASQAVDIDAIADPPEAYIQFANKRLVAVDYHRAEIVYEHQIGYGESWRGRGVRALPGGDIVCPLTAHMTTGFAATYGLWTAPEDWTQTWDCALEFFPVAMCVGPHPNHLIALHRNQDCGFSVVDTTTGNVVRTYDHDFTHPEDIEATPDGKWIVTVDYGAPKLTALVAEEFRADLAMPRSVYSIRRYDCPLRARPAGVAVHPTLPVAYVWSTEESRITVVDLGEVPE